jgi:hypothetical protein
MTVVDEPTFEASVGTPEKVWQAIQCATTNSDAQEGQA